MRRNSKIDENTIQGLREYLLEKGFKYNNVWYFRTSWIDRSLKQTLQNAGLIKKIGTCIDLDNLGIRLPGTFLYNNRRRDGAIIYRLNDPKINKLI